MSSENTPSPGESTAAPTPSNKPTPLKGHRILVVESEAEVAEQLVSVLEEMGHTAELASDAKSALYSLHDFEPHLVLLGTYLADMPGYELSAILHGAPQYSYKFRHIALLFVGDRRKLLKHRFTGAPDVPMSRYIFKPINPVEVRDKIDKVLRQTLYPNG